MLEIAILGFQLQDPQTPYGRAHHFRRKWLCPSLNTFLYPGLSKRHYIKEKPQEDKIQNCISQSEATKASSMSGEYISLPALASAHLIVNVGESTGSSGTRQRAESFPMRRALHRRPCPAQTSEPVLVESTFCRDRYEI